MPSTTLAFVFLLDGLAPQPATTVDGDPATEA
jgi:hypothetical protein